MLQSAPNVFADDVREQSPPELHLLLVFVRRLIPARRLQHAGDASLEGLIERGLDLAQIALSGERDGFIRPHIVSFPVGIDLLDADHRACRGIQGEYQLQGLAAGGWVPSSRFGSALLLLVRSLIGRILAVDSQGILSGAVWVTVNCRADLLAGRLFVQSSVARSTMFIRAGARLRAYACSDLKLVSLQLTVHAAAISSC